ncbi:MAG: stage V sporulation protein S [Chloroflexi bacterium]|nr:stage V sporulation protein S [Chloroflexota bacterium]MBK8935183.1 stage V sporulation protein S [Chloroflexota bacterium]MBP6803075.1 stage V sporulation protein S [Chloroflexota bacterium]MBP7591675.1 stage V sporulation protein S [Chloroflexota bacterium]
MLVTHNRKSLSPERIGITTYDRAEISPIGVGAVNQAIKPFIIAKGYLAEEGSCYHGSSRALMTKRTYRPYQYRTSSRE